MSDDEDKSTHTPQNPGTSAEHGENDHSLEIASTRISVKAPPFWRANPALWFCQLEAQFDLNRITRDRSKYNTVVAAIESSVLHQVSDIVLNPPATDLYIALKKRLLDVFVESEQSRLKKLLGEIELGEQKPSSLLREMRSLAGASISDELLKTLFLQRLPTNIQAILSISSEGIEKLATMADKIYETSSYKHEEIATMSRSTSTDLQTQIAKLSQQIASMQSNYSSRGRDASNKSFQNKCRSRSSTPHRKKQFDSTKEAKLCWYHNKFGDKATSCVGNCDFRPNAGN